MPTSLFAIIIETNAVSERWRAEPRTAVRAVGEGLRAFHDAVERKVDYARVNGRLFVNNVSLGVYAAIEAVKNQGR